MTDKEIQKAGEEVFGSFDIEAVRASEPGRMEKFRQEAKEFGAEMDLFIESLPNWVDDAEYFNLYLMNEKEREQWLAKNSPYFQRTTVHAAPVSVGNYRI